MITFIPIFSIELGICNGSIKLGTYAQQKKKEMKKKGKKKYKKIYFTIALCYYSKLCVSSPHNMVSFKTGDVLGIPS